MNYTDALIKEYLIEELAHKNYTDFMALLNNSKIDNDRFNIEQFKKYSNDKGDFICWLENDDLMAAAFIRKNVLDINDTYINEVQTLKKGYGKKLISDIIKSNQIYYVFIILN